MQVVLIASNTSFPERSCEVTVQLKEQIGQISRVADTLTFIINKPYVGISAALEYECAVFLSQNGYAVSVPDVVPDGVLPEQSDPVQV